MPIKDGLNPTRVRVADAPVRAYDFLWQVISTQRHRHPLDDAAALIARFTAGEVRLRDATPVPPDAILAPGTDVYFYRIPAVEIPVPHDIPILFEDDNLLVADKPPFMATMPRARHITETATVRLRRATGIDELSPAHRLDRLTAGVLVFTKSRAVRGAYQRLFAERAVTKTYQAVAPFKKFDLPTVWRSRMEKTPGEIQGRIVDGEPNSVTSLESVDPIADQAHWEFLHGQQPPLAVYSLKPLTGKTHQLRLHMWAAGVPILGDPVYPVIYPADAENMNIPMHLTAKSIEFTDPFTGEQRHFESRR